MIAFLGMGLLGSNFVRAFRQRDEPVQVWSRNPARAQALADTGAVVTASPEAAARGAKRIHLALSDDAAVDEVLQLARPGFEKDVVLVDHTTTSPAGTRARASRWAERGVSFQHAPVFMTPQNALEATGLMLASGEKDRFDRLEPELAKMTGKLVYLGAEPERAASFKLLGNSFLIVMTAGFADFLALAKSFGVAPREAASLFKFFNPGVSVPARLERLIAAKFEEPSFELAMARKDARLMIENVARTGGSLAVLPAIAEAMDRFIARGHGHDDWTVIAKDALTGD